MKMENNEKQDQKYVLSDELKNLLFQNLSTKPYGEVFNVLNFITSDTTGIILESQLDLILGYMGKLPYNVVVNFFRQLPELLVKYEDMGEDEFSKPDAQPKESKPVAKGKASTKKPEVKEEKFEDQLSDLESFI